MGQRGCTRGPVRVHAVVQAAVALFTLAGCQGATVDPPDAGGSDAEVKSEAGCPAVAGNLVQNPSFEKTTAGSVSGWSDPEGGTLTLMTDGAAHCGDAWVKIDVPAASTSFPFYFGQDLTLSRPAVSGSVIRASFWAKSVTGDLIAAIRVGETSGAYHEKAFTMNGDQSWAQFEIEWPYPDGATALHVDFISVGKEPRAVGLDDFAFTIVPP